jgi:hypothetical protein
MQARLDKERYQQALTEYQQRLTMSEAGLEESQGEEPYAMYQPQRKRRRQVLLLHLSLQSSLALTLDSRIHQPDVWQSCL